MDITSAYIPSRAGCRELPDSYPLDSQPNCERKDEADRQIWIDDTFCTQKFEEARTHIVIKIHSHAVSQKQSRA